MCRNKNTKVWFGDLFSHWHDENFSTVGNGYYDIVIPYNDDTKHLVGTTDEAPEYYRYWED
ncbi:hypothetical protein [Intestinibacter sp.]|uniref:hypothetical protein n=1 Tax=Intestinibacter sp. TaxID=1965304 RepID=UPI003F13B6D1